MALTLMASTQATPYNETTTAIKHRDGQGVKGGRLATRDIIDHRAYIFLNRTIERERAFRYLATSRIPMLSESERAQLVSELIISLDSFRDESVADAWHAEIERRTKQVKAGNATLISRDEFRQRMRSRLMQAL